MEYSFRESMIVLDEIGFIGNPSHKYSTKDEYLFSVLFQALKNVVNNSNNKNSTTLCPFGDRIIETRIDNKNDK